MPAIPQIEYAISHAPMTLPIRKHKFDTPKLRLQLNDLAHDGSSIFLSNFKGNEDFEEQVQTVLNLLYTKDCKSPGTRSVTLVIRDMDGVAYTTGMDLDNDHKEIHFNLSYINRPRGENQRRELLGVICHELVHCFQWDAEGTCDGGLIEGIADWVRLRAGLAAKHWKREAGGDWNGGYEHTGYFLEYLETRFGPGTVRRINGCLRKGQYDEDSLFKECCQNHCVADLWKDYVKHLKKEEEREEATSDAQNVNQKSKEDIKSCA